MTVTIPCPECGAEVTVELMETPRADEYELIAVDGSCVHALAYNLACAHVHDPESWRYEDRVFDRAVTEARPR